MAGDHVHNLPLARDLVFEIASVPSTPDSWREGSAMPHARDWARLSPIKAHEVVRARNEHGRFPVFYNWNTVFLNHGVGRMGMRKYNFRAEYEGLYHLTHCSLAFPDKLVRQAHPKYLYLRIVGQTIFCRNLAGDDVYAYTVRIGDSLRAIDLRMMLRDHLIENQLCTPNTPLKVLHHVTLKEFRGNCLLLSPPAYVKRARRRVQRRVRGQTLITHFFKPVRVLPRIQ